MYPYLKPVPYLDAHPLNGLNYYRLPQVDGDGQAVFSPIVFVKMDAKTAISVAPNPLGDEPLQITLPPFEETCHVRLFDGFGSLIQSWTIDADSAKTIYVDLTGTPAGIFFLQIDGAEPLGLIKL